MSFFTNLRADRLIEQIKSSTNLMGAETQKAIAKLKDAGPGAIDAVIAALPEADKHATVAFVDVLATLASAKTFPQIRAGTGPGQPALDRWSRLGADQQPRLSAATCCSRRWQPRVSPNRRCSTSSTASARASPSASC